MLTLANKWDKVEKSIDERGKLFGRKLNAIFTPSFDSLTNIDWERKLFENKKTVW